MHVLNRMIAGCVAGLWAIGTTANGQVLPQLQQLGNFTIEEGVTERSLLRDINADGLADVVLRIDFPLEVRVRLAQGDGTFGPVIASSAYSDEAFGFALGKLNADEFADAVVGNPDWDASNLAVLIGSNTGSFSSGGGQQNGSSSFPLVAIGDVNGDGHGDIVSNTFVALSVLLGDGTGNFAPAAISGSAGTVGDILLDDLDGDGDLDTVQVSDSLNNNNAISTVRVNHNNGKGVFSSPQSFTLPTRVRAGFLTPGFYLAHLNNDDRLDLVVFGIPGTHTGPGGLFLLFNVGGTFQQVYHQTHAQMGTDTDAVEVGDFNGDGLDDVIVVRGANNEIRVSNGTGGFAAVVPFSGPSDADAALVGHFTGSALPDLILASTPISPIETFTIYVNVTETPAVIGDVTGDGVVNVNDLLAVINNWGPCAKPCPPNCVADVTNDCSVTVNDLLMVINNWSE